MSRWPFSALCGAIRRSGLSAIHRTVLLTLADVCGDGPVEWSVARLCEESGLGRDSKAGRRAIEAMAKDWPGGDLIHRQKRPGAVPVWDLHVERVTAMRKRVRVADPTPNGRGYPTPNGGGSDMTPHAERHGPPTPNGVDPPRRTAGGHPSIVARACPSSDSSSVSLKNPTDPSGTLPGFELDSSSNTALEGDVETTRQVVARLVNYWAGCMGKSSVARKLTTKSGKQRARLIAARLNEGYSAETIIEAIHGCHRTPFNMGANDSGKRHNDLTLICRSGEKLEMFAEKWRDIGGSIQPNGQVAASTGGTNTFAPTPGLEVAS